MPSPTGIATQRGINGADQSVQAMQNLQVLFGRSQAAGIHVDPALALGRFDWSANYRPTPLTSSPLDPVQQFSLPLQAQSGGATVGLMFLTKQAGFAATGTPMDFRVLGFNAADQFSPGLSLNSSLYTSSGQVNVARLAEQRYLKSGPAGSRGQLTGGESGLAMSHAIDLKSARSSFSGLWSSVGKDFTLGSLSLDGVGNSDALKTLAAERGVTRLQFNGGYDLSKTGALSMGFDQLHDQKGSLLEETLAGHTDRWSVDLVRRSIDSSFDSFSGLRESQFRGLKSGLGLNSTGLNLGFQPSKGSQLSFGALQASGRSGTGSSGSGSGLDRQTLGFTNSHFHLNLVNQDVGSHFNSLANIGDSAAIADALGPGSHFRSVATGLQLSPTRSFNLTDSEKTGSGGAVTSRGAAFQWGKGALLGFDTFDAHENGASFSRQSLALALGGLSVKSQSLNVGSHFADGSHFVAAADQGIIAKEQGLSQNALSIGYMASKNLNLSYASSSVRDQNGGLTRMMAGIHTALLDLDLKQASVDPRFHSAGLLTSPALVAFGATPGLRDQNLGLALHLSKVETLKLARLDASDPRGQVQQNQLSFQYGPNYLFEWGERSVSAGFHSFNQALGLGTLAPEAGTSRQDFHIKAGQEKHNYIDATLTQMASLEPGGVHLNGMSLSPETAMQESMDLWAGVGSLADPNAKGAAGAVPAVTAAKAGAAAGPGAPAAGGLNRMAVKFGLDPSRQTQVEGSFLSFTNGLAFQSTMQRARGITLNLKQQLGKDSEIALVHNTMDVDGTTRDSLHSDVEGVNLKLNTRDGLHVTGDYLNQQLPDHTKDMTKGNIDIADGSLQLDAHFADALDPSGVMKETRTGDIQYAVSRNLTLHLQNTNGETQLTTGGLASTFSAPTASTPAPPPGAVQQPAAGALPSQPATMPGQAMALKQVIGGGIMGLVLFRGVDPNSLGIGGQQLSFATDPRPSLPLHLNAAYNVVTTPTGLKPVRRMDLSYSPLHNLTLGFGQDQNRLMPDGKLLDGGRTQYTLTTPLMKLALSNQVDPTSHRRMEGDLIQLQDRLTKNIKVQGSLAQNPESPTGSIEHAMLRQFEATTGPFTSFYRESKPLTGRIGITRGINGTWKMSHSWNLNLAVTDNPLDLKGNVIRGETQTLGLDGTLLGGLKFKFDRTNGIVDPVTHTHLYSTHIELTGGLKGCGTLSAVYRNDLTAADSNSWMWSQFTKLGLDPAPILQQDRGELRGDVYALQYAYPTSNDLSFTVDGAYIHPQPLAANQPTTALVDLRVGLKASF